MYRRGNARLADFSIRFITWLRVQRKRAWAMRLTSVFPWPCLLVWGIRIYLRVPRRSGAAYETVKAGQRCAPCRQTCFSELEFL